MGPISPEKFLKQKDFASATPRGLESTRVVGQGRVASEVAANRNTRIATRAAPFATRVAKNNNLSALGALTITSEPEPALSGSVASLAPDDIGTKSRTCP